MILKSKQTGIIDIFKTDVDPGFNFLEKFKGDVQRYMSESEDFITNIRFTLKNGKGKYSSFNGQSTTSRLSIKEI